VEAITRFDPLNLSVEEKNDFVYRLLSDRCNQTEDVVSGLMEKAIVAPNPIADIGSPWCSRPATLEEKQAFRDMCRKMAIKFLWILKRSKSGWIPRQSCVDLTTTGAALTRDEQFMSVAEVREKWLIESPRRAVQREHAPRCPPRRFKNCKYSSCEKRFLARRSNQEFCNSRCARRYAKAKGRMVVETVQPVSGA
jgi:hypothetical protein